MIGEVLQAIFKVGTGYTCKLTLPIAALHGVGLVSVDAEWAPRLPTRLTEAEWRDYRHGRDTLFREAARLTGKRTAVVEL